MLTRDALKNLLADGKLGVLDRLLMCLAVDSHTPKAVKDVTELARGHGFRGVRNVNVSDRLRRSKGLAIRVHDGWELTSAGIERVKQIAGPLMNSPVPKVASSLRTHLASIANKQTAAFVEEAIACFEMRQYRAAVVLSWVGATSLLYDHVVKYQLAAFNADAVVRFSKAKSPWQPAKTADDLSRMKESDFLTVLEKISVIGKNVKEQLEVGLRLRNSCGHPNSYTLGENKVSAHVEDLMLNVFSKF